MLQGNKMQSAQSILTSTDKFHIDLGLERTLLALERLNNPQDYINFIHVAGTNGKGSVCAMLNEILCEHFLNSSVNVGLFTSPHLFSYCERIKINNVPITCDDLDKYIKIALEAGEELTEFELLSVAAMKYFYDKNVKYVILEVGLGGRYDSTNVIKKPICSVITTIDFDHTARLGSTIDEIAYQKAGIIKHNCPTVVSVDNKGYGVIKSCVNEQNSPLYTVENNLKIEFDGKNNYVYINGKKLPFSLLGDWQSQNLALVLEAVKTLPFKVSEQTVADAIKKVKWRFRLEYDRDKNLLIDGAHNPSGIRALRDFLDKYFKNEKKTFIFGCLNNKDYEKMLEILLNEGDELYFYEFNYPNALKYEQLPDNIKQRSQKTCDPRKILDEKQNLKVVCGSLYMLGKLFNAG